MNIELKWHEDDDNPGRAYAEGADLTINGHRVHVAALRALCPSDEEYGLQTSFSADHEEEFDRVAYLADGRMQTGELPGLEGQWIVFAIAWGD